MVGDGPLEIGDEGPPAGAEVAGTGADEVASEVGAVEVLLGVVDELLVAGAVEVADGLVVVLVLVSSPLESSLEQATEPASNAAPTPTPAASTRNRFSA